MGRKKRAVQTSHAMPMIQAQRLAKEMGAAEAAEELHPFSISQALRDDPSCNGKQRDAALRKAWTWACRKTILKRYHLDVVLMRAAIEQKLASQPHAKPTLVRAHRRLQLAYFKADEYGLSRKHAGFVMELSEALIRRDPLVLGPQFWRMAAKCDVEIYKVDTKLLQHPFVEDEAEEAVALAKREEAAKKAKVQAVLNAKRHQAELARRKVEKEKAKIERAEKRREERRMAGLPSDDESESATEEERVPEDERSLTLEDEASFASAASKVDDLREQDAIEAVAQETYEEERRKEARLREALVYYRRCLNSTTIGFAVVGQIPKLFMELAALYEAFGAYEGAIGYYKAVVE